MIDLVEREAREIRGGGELAWTLCGVTFGAAVAATLLWNVTGFFLTVNKAITACGIAVATSGSSERDP